MASSNEILRGDPIDDCVDLSDAARQLSIDVISRTFDHSGGGATVYTNIVELGPGDDSSAVDVPSRRIVDTDLAPAHEPKKPERRLRNAFGYLAGAIGSAALALTLFTNMGENQKLEAEQQAEYYISQGDNETAQAIREDTPDHFTMQEARWLGIGFAGSAAALGYFVLGGLGINELAEERKARRR